MRKYLMISAAVAALGFSPVANAALTEVYTDPVGDVFTTAGGGILDITSVEVTQNATDLIFKINLAGDPVATDWGKYMVGIDSKPGGDSAGNGWGRPISMPGMDFWLGSWVDSGNGAELRTWDGSAWQLQSATYGPNPDNLAIFKDNSSVTLSVNLSGLGMVLGDSFIFDVYTSGGQPWDSAIDALSNPNQTIGDWDESYNSGSFVSFYPIPEPSTLGLAVLGGLAALGLAMRRRS